MLSLLGNILWFVFGGLWLGLAWIVIGALCYCTIIDIPFGLGCFKLAKVRFAPLGKSVV